MPLHTHAEALVLHLDGLGNAVGCHGHEAHAVAEPYRRNNDGSS